MALIQFAITTLFMVGYHDVSAQKIFLERPQKVRCPEVGTITVPDVPAPKCIGDGYQV